MLKLRDGHYGFGASSESCCCCGSGFKLSRVKLWSLVLVTSDLSFSVHHSSRNAYTHMVRENRKMFVGRTELQIQQ